jgi:hypothetical protein
MPRYVVTAPSEVLGHAPGSEFDPAPDVPEVQLERLLESGAIAPSGKAPSSPSSPAPDKE